MQTAAQFFEFFLLLLALRQLRGVPWDYLLNELVFLRQLTPQVVSRFELYETCVVFSPQSWLRLYFSQKTRGEAPFSCLSAQMLRFLGSAWLNNSASLGQRAFHHTHRHLYAYAMNT